MEIEYLTGLNVIMMKAIWNVEKKQNEVTIQDLIEEVKKNTGKEYHRSCYHCQYLFCGPSCGMKLHLK